MMRNTTVVYAQTPILKSQLEKLKRLSGTTSTKDALHAAVNHYLSCQLVRERADGKWKVQEGEKIEDDDEANITELKKLGGDR